MHPYLGNIVGVVVSRSRFILHRYTANTPTPQDTPTKKMVFPFKLFCKVFLTSYCVIIQLSHENFPLDRKKNRKSALVLSVRRLVCDKSDGAWLTSRGPGSARFVEIKQPMAQITFVL